MAETRRNRALRRGGLLLAACVLASSSLAQTLYKYRGTDGEWIYADRPPDDGQVDETRALAGPPQGATPTVKADTSGPSVRLVAENPLYIPVELQLRFTRLEGFELPDPDSKLLWVLPAQSRMPLLDLAKLGDGTVPLARFSFEYRPGDPAAVHRPDAPYRVPVAIATQFPVTQAYPAVTTHTTDDSRYAVDIAMPIGTDIFAARDGVVFAVSADNFRSGLDLERDGPAANVVQVLHDDGTWAVYAHLNWNSIRVHPGDRVVRGQYIADSGNTGYSSGPHLHFVVLRNAGQRVVSIPVGFKGVDSASVLPSTGTLLTAY